MGHDSPLSVSSQTYLGEASTLITGSQHDAATRVGHSATMIYAFYLDAIVTGCLVDWLVSL